MQDCVSQYLSRNL